MELCLMPLTTSNVILWQAVLVVEVSVEMSETTNLQQVDVNVQIFPLKKCKKLLNTKGYHLN